MKTIESKAQSYANNNASTQDDDRIRISLRNAYIAGATEALRSQWKDASKELPEEDEYVLIDGPRGIEAAWWNSHYQCWDDAEGDDNMYDKDKVSHWLPIPDLPEPPKDESE